MKINYFVLKESARRFIQLGDDGYIYECLNADTIESTEDLMIKVIKIDSINNLKLYCKNELVTVVPLHVLITVSQNDHRYIKINDLKFLSIDYSTLLSIMNLALFEDFTIIDNMSFAQAIATPCSNPFAAEPPMDEINVNVGVFPGGVMCGGVLNLNVRGRKTSDYYLSPMNVLSILNSIACNPSCIANVMLRGDMFRTKLQTGKEFKMQYAKQIENGEIKKIKFKRIRNDIIGIEFGDYLDLFPVEALEITKVLPDDIYYMENMKTNK